MKRATTIRTCKLHGETEFAEATESGKITWRCRKCRYEALKKRRKKLKIELVAYKGGKCEHCGYSKCVEALEFHHTDPNEKDFGFSNGSVVGIAKLKEEVDKCILLCANCHREEHVRLRLDVL